MFALRVFCADGKTSLSKDSDDMSTSSVLSVNFNDDTASSSSTSTVATSGRLGSSTGDLRRPLLHDFGGGFSKLKDDYTTKREEMWRLYEECERAYREAEAARLALYNEAVTLHEKLTQKWLTVKHGKEKKRLGDKKYALEWQMRLHQNRDVSPFN